jgi:trehalose 6-phosphate phosphatase
MELATEQARDRYEALVARASQVVVGLDFDGTLAPIVEDPSSAVIHPDAPPALARLASVVRAVVVVTGRPARQVVDLGGLDELADSLPEGATLAVMGQYGHERWDSHSHRFTSPEPPAGLSAFREELPRLLASADASDAVVEEKGIAVAVHTRPLPDAKEAFARLEEVLADAAERHGLQLEPGRLVLEVRTPGMHKGLAIRRAIEDHDGGGALFVGDDLGDIEAFRAVRDLREDGLPALLVCSSSDEEEALAELADVVVDGPAGVVGLLSSFADDAAR